MKSKVGDKVRLKASQARGVVQEANKSLLTVLLDDGAIEKVEESEVTNYSLAARKAWESMPDRRVGRPKGSSKTDRVSVTLRIDKELWKWFQSLEKAGMITDRTGTVNKWIAEKLNDLEDQ